MRGPSLPGRRRAEFARLNVVDEVVDAFPERRESREMANGGTVRAGIPTPGTTSVGKRLADASWPAWAADRWPMLPRLDI